MSVKNGAIRLLQSNDFNLQNVFGHPLVGWKSTSMGEGGIFNPRGFALLRVIVQSLIDGVLQDIYDQPMLVENAGAIVVPISNGNVGMIQSFRMTGDRIIDADPLYVAHLNEQQKWQELLGSLGRWSWELPRGIPPAKVAQEPDQKPFTSDDELALATAQMEALEEAGLTLENKKVVGSVNANPTFFVHSQRVVRGYVVKQGTNQPENLEIIGKTQFFSPSEIRSMVDSRELDDGLTLASLAIAGIHF